MAKQTGFLKIIGTIGDITFYEMDGEFYARKKSSLDGKRVKRDPKFKRTMDEAIGFGKASAATRAVYWALPEELRVHGFYGRLTGRMRRLMRAGKNAKEAQLQLLRDLCAEQGTTVEKDVVRKSQFDGFADQVLKKIFKPSENSTHEQRPQHNLRQWLSDEREEISMLLQEMGKRKIKVVVVVNNEDSEHKGAVRSRRRISRSGLLEVQEESTVPCRGIIKWHQFAIG
jgi:hypothetical protein